MSTDDDYDKLSKEEREARDKADREREAAEQAGAYRAHIPLRANIPAEASQHFPTSGSKSWGKSTFWCLFQKAPERGT